jgi:hypothetical protein
LAYEWAFWLNSLLVYQLAQLRVLLMAARLADLTVSMWVESRERQMACPWAVKKVQRWVWKRVDKLVGRKVDLSERLKDDCWVVQLAVR